MTPIPESFNQQDAESNDPVSRERICVALNTENLEHCEAECGTLSAAQFQQKMSSSFWGSSDRKKDPATKGSDTTEPDTQLGSEKALKTVTLTERELRAATQLLKVLAGVEEDRGRELTNIFEKAAGTDSFQGREPLVERARQMIADRSQRLQFFHKVMFREAAWDMLLALYVAEQSGVRHTVSELLNRSGVAPTTALRWLDFLRQEQLVARRSSPTDRRVFYVELTEEGLKALDAYFSATTAPRI